MKFKRLLSFFVVAAVAATTITIPAAADSASAPTVLFSDDFDSGYENGIISKHSGNNYTNLTGAEFEKSNAIGVSNDSSYFYPDKMERPGDGDKTFVLKNNAGIGSNNVLDVTTQAGLNSCSWMIKKSGITSENIGGKELTFTANFMIPTDNGYIRGNGVFVYLDNLGNATEDGTGQIMPSTRYQFGQSLDWQFNESADFKSKILLGIESEGYDKTPCVFAFGEKLADIEVGKTYSYKLILTPNGDGGYIAKAKINGVIHELSGANLPTVDKMTGYQFAMIGEKANPYIISASVEENSKYQNDKTIALLDDLCFTASEPAPESDTLFSDDFSGYTGEYIAKAEKNEIGYYNTENYTLHSDVNSENYMANNEEKISAGDASHIAKLVDSKFASSSGKTLQLTSQGIVTKGSMYKLSNITNDKIKDKALVFNAKFKIPSDGIYNRGVGFAAGLSPVNSDGTAPDAVCASRDFQIYESHLKNKYKFFAANGLDFYVFGEKQWELQKGMEYSYTLKLYPNGDGTYKAAATLNDDEVLVESSNIPTQAEIKDYKYSFIALHNHGWNTYAGSLVDGTSNYTSNQPLVYIDDISLERKNPSEVAMPKADEPLTDEELGAYGLFNADFEDYSAEYVKKATSDELAQYEKNSFVLNNGAKTVVPGKYGELDGNDGRIEEGDISKLFKIVKNGGFGSGTNYLSIQSQGLIAGGTMWTRSNITPARINNKTLKFNAKFKIPSDGKWGNGRGAAIIFADAAADGTKPNGAIGSVDMNVNDLNSKYSLATVFYYDGAAKLGVFGENIGDVEIGKVYEVTVTMVPNAEGNYTVTAKLNDTEKVLEGKKIVDGVETETVPTMSELKNYAFIGVVGHTVAYNTIATSDTETGKYLKDKDLIWFDDISLKRANNFVLDETNGINGISDLTSDGEIDMAKKYITLNLGETIARVDLSKITIDNGATVMAAEIDSTDSKKLKLVFDGLNLNTAYKIRVAGVVNPLGIEYSQEFSLRTSAGIDVNYANIKLEDGVDGKKKVTVPVAKAAGVAETVKPAIIVSVYDESVTDEPMLKKSYVKEDEVTTQTSIEITGIDVEAGDKVRVFVWDGFTTMRPLTRRVDLQ